MTTQAHWAVCQMLSKREHRIRAEIESTNRGTFLPTYARIWSSEGKRSSRERALMPGYLFFWTDPNDWYAVKNIHGVYGVLANCGKTSRVTDGEMFRMVVDHATGAHNQIEHLPETRQQRIKRRRRRPRPGKRLRAALNASVG